MPLLRPDGSNSPEDVLNPAERAVYHAIYFSRGDYTNVTVGFLTSIVRLQDAIFRLKMLATDNRTSGEQRAFYKVTIALLTRQRDKDIDEFYRRWTPEQLKSELDHEPPSTPQPEDDSP